MNKLSGLLLILLFIGWSGVAEANCICRCVDGVNTPICYKGSEVPPICPPKNCPATPRGDANTSPTRRIISMPPKDKIGCHPEQVFNSSLQKLQWKMVCN